MCVWTCNEIKGSNHHHSTEKISFVCCRNSLHQTGFSLLSQCSISGIYSLYSEYIPNLINFTRLFTLVGTFFLSNTVTSGSAIRNKHGGRSASHCARERWQAEPPSALHHHDLLSLVDRCVAMLLLHPWLLATYDWRVAPFQNKLNNLLKIMSFVLKRASKLNT